MHSHFDKRTGLFSQRQRSFSGRARQGSIFGRHRPGRFPRSCRFTRYIRPFMMQDIQRLAGGCFIVHAVRAKPQDRDPSGVVNVARPSPPLMGGSDSECLPGRTAPIPGRHSWRNPSNGGEPALVRSGDASNSLRFDQRVGCLEDAAPASHRTPPKSGTTSRTQAGGGSSMSSAQMLTERGTHSGLM
jgi:hypothetical protein